MGNKVEKELSPLEQVEANRLRERLLKLRGKKTQLEVAVGAKVGYKTYCTWENAKRLPTSRSLSKLAEFFGVSKSSLLR